MKKRNCHQRCAPFARLRPATSTRLSSRTMHQLTPLPRSANNLGHVLFQSNGGKSRPHVMLERQQLGVTYLSSSMPIRGFFRNTFAVWSRRSSAALSAVAHGCRPIAKFLCGAEFFFAFLLLCILDLISVPAPFSSRAAKIFVLLAVSMKCILRVKKFFSPRP